MSRSTVNHAVGRLLAERRIAEASAHAGGPGSGSGRPATRLSVVTTDRFIGAIDFGHNHVHVAVGNSLGEPLADVREVLDVDLNARESMRCAADLLAALQRRLGVSEVAMVTAGIPGPIDTHTGLVRSPSILSNWLGKAPAADLEDLLGVPVHIANDAALGAVGEQRRGAGRHHRDFLYVKAGHGIGASMVLDGHVYWGASGLAGEIGHTPLPGHSDICRCGNRGCLEAVVSVGSLFQQYAHAYPNSQVNQCDPNDATDPVTSRIFEDAGRLVGGVLATLCNLLNPAALILGGALGANSTPFRIGVEAAVRRHAQPAIEAAMEILPAELGTRAELVGGLQLAAELVRS